MMTLSVHAIVLWPDMVVAINIFTQTYSRKCPMLAQRRDQLQKSAIPPFSCNESLFALCKGSLSSRVEALDSLVA